jgi:hypothetical protein
VEIFYVMSAENTEIGLVYFDFYVVTMTFFQLQKLNSVMNNE